MAPDPRLVKAFRTKKSLGISGNEVKPVLKILLKLYDKNWDFIEEDNYRVLVDTLFEEKDTTKVSGMKDDAGEEDLHEEVQVLDEPKRPSKVLCLSSQDGQSPLSLHKCHPAMAEIPLRKQTLSPSPLAGQGSSNQSDPCAIDTTLLMGKIDALSCKKAVLEEKLRLAKEEGQEVKGVLQLQISEAKTRAEQVEKEAERAKLLAMEVTKENNELKERLCCDEEFIVEKLLQSDMFQKLQATASIQ